MSRQSQLVLRVYKDFYSDLWWRLPGWRCCTCKLYDGSSGGPFDHLWYWQSVLQARTHGRMPCHLWRHGNRIPRFPYPKYGQILSDDSGTSTCYQSVDVPIQYLTFSGQVAKASTKLEVLEALKFYDVDSSMHTLMAKVEVCVIRADYEQVVRFTFLLIWRRWRALHNGSGTWRSKTRTLESYYTSCRCMEKSFWY